MARLQLEAQIQYRLGNNKEAIRLYSELFQQHKVPSFICYISYSGIVREAAGTATPG